MREELERISREAQANLNALNKCILKLFSIQADKMCIDFVNSAFFSI